MLKNNKVAPRLAFVSCGLFSDPEGAYAESEEYMKQQEAKLPKPQPQPVPQPQPQPSEGGDE